MKVNPLWTTWIYSSFVVYFKTKAQSINFPIFFLGEIRDPAISDFCEFRLEGPYFNEINRSYWEIDAHIAILSTMTIDESNIYKIHNISGKITNMFDKDIPMFRYNSDKTQLGCMRLATGRNEKIIQNVYGQIQPGVPITQTSTEAHYHMELGFNEFL